MFKLLKNIADTKIMKRIFFILFMSFFYLSKLFCQENAEVDKMRDVKSIVERYLNYNLLFNYRKKLVSIKFEKAPHDRLATSFNKIFWGDLINGVQFYSVYITINLEEGKQLRFFCSVTDSDRQVTSDFQKDNQDYVKVRGCDEDSQTGLKMSDVFSLPIAHYFDSVFELYHLRKSETESFNSTHVVSKNINDSDRSINKDLPATLKTSSHLKSSRRE